MPDCVHQPAALSAAVAAAWLTDASPNEQTTIASAGHAVSATPSRRARSMAKATPTARGRCEAIVEVVGMTARSGWPKTLCRPPAIGSSDDATRPRSTSRIASARAARRPPSAAGALSAARTR